VPRKFYREIVDRDSTQSPLRAAGGHRSQVAQKLGIGEATLYRMIKQFGDG
jgi:transcriptional regulator of acetoin/glycerol metabolism